MTDPQTMTPADVPDELVLAAAKALLITPDIDDDGETDLRALLAAVLPIHAQQLGEKLGKLTIPCYRHSARPGFDNDCISCHRYAALVGARRLIEGRDTAPAAIRQLHADTERDHEQGGPF